MNFFLTRNFYLFIITFFVLLLTIRCSEDIMNPKNEITVEDDAVIGRTIDKALLYHIDTSSNIALLDPQRYPAVYTYIDQISQSINNSNSFSTLAPDPQGTSYQTNNLPTIRVIDQASNTGAFVLPGGYIYLYKGLLNKISDEAQFVPILTHLMTCSKNRYDIKKLETRFSTNFLLDLAIGGTINNDPGLDISTILNALENEPYSTSTVNLLDKEAEKTVCELGYNVQTYGNFFSLNTNIKWFQQFPRTLSLNDYASHLFNTRDSLSCNGDIGRGGYGDFLDSLN